MTPVRIELNGHSLMYPQTLPATSVRRCDWGTDLTNTYARGSYRQRT